MRALILLDLQNDYGAFGALPVSGAEEIIPRVNKLMDQFSIVAATQDWHPANHTCFAANHPWRHPEQVIEIDGLKQELSIIHCVQNSFGAELMSGLNTDKILQIFQKGADVKTGSYSAFYDKNKRRNTGLGDWLKDNNVTEVFVLGLTTEGSVLATVLDAIDLGFKTYFIEDTSYGMSDELASEAKKMMIDNGAVFINFADVIH